MKKLYSLNFYLSGEKYIHQRQLYTYWQLIDNFGGMVGIFLPALFVLNSTFSHIFIMSKLITALYFKSPDFDENSGYYPQSTQLMKFFFKKKTSKRNVVHEVNFTNYQLVMSLIFKPCSCCLKKFGGLYRQVKLFDYLQTRLEDEMKLVKVVQR